MSEPQGLTRFGRWLYRQPSAVQVTLYWLLLPIYLVAGVVIGARDGFEEWRHDRRETRT